MDEVQVDVKYTGGSGYEAYVRGTLVAKRRYVRTIQEDISCVLRVLSALGLHPVVNLPPNKPELEVQI